MWNNAKQPNIHKIGGLEWEERKRKTEKNIWRNDGQTFSKPEENYKSEDPKSSKNPKYPKAYYKKLLKTRDKEKKLQATRHYKKTYTEDITYKEKDDSRFFRKNNASQKTRNILRSKKGGKQSSKILIQLNYHSSSKAN